MAFTIVFEGNIRDIDGNPMLIESPFGKPIASGIGNAFDVIENIHEIEELAGKLVAAIARYDADQ